MFHPPSGSGWVWACCIAMQLVGCSSETSGPTLPHFADLTSAPAAIQAAAKAVIRIHTGGQSGTGSFISPFGLLLTNNHILGVTVCPVEGCYFEITQQHQRGQVRLKPVVVFGVPVAVDVGLDMALVQVYDGPGGAQLTTPDYLSVNPLSGADLLGKHVTVVGHPEGYLKKWTDGTVADVSGEWFTCTAYSLPGESGSPVLDDGGQIVGLLHRGPTSEDLISDVGVNLYSIGTAAANLEAAFANPLPNVMLSVKADTTADAFVGHDVVYLNARTATVSIAGNSTPALTLLAAACDAALARDDFVSPNDLSAALTPCYDAHLWIECRSDVSAKTYGTVCPATDDRAWITRNQAINQAWLRMNGQFDYTAVSFSMAALASTSASGVTMGAGTLQAALAPVAPPLDPTLAYYLAAFDIDSYAGTSIHDYVANYTRIPHYELDARHLAWAATWLWGNGLMDKAGVTALLKKLLDDPKVGIGDQLAIEDYLYGIDAL